ncbi:hypothetical protein RHSIM_Rhsim09G0139200 [Rhododendron simsii]|uniref:Uncharacterized protein n=1 Tax=Rhododendron simsii TaxID=118357 RepID=A0A834GJ84_RHOSS|nr:hypothetical protein RHSIM_Rhsim09G0139200 [Rhododendron simsii]
MMKGLIARRMLPPFAIRLEEPEQWQGCFFMVMGNLKGQGLEFKWLFGNYFSRTGMLLLVFWWMQVIKKNTKDSISLRRACSVVDGERSQLLADYSREMF